MNTTEVNKIKKIKTKINHPATVIPPQSHPKQNYSMKWNENEKLKTCMETNGNYGKQSCLSCNWHWLIDVLTYYIFYR